MNRSLLTVAVVATLGANALPTPASANDGSSVGFRLTAVVQPFCRIQSELGDSPVTLVDGAVDLGSVREVCNTQGGYNIAVQLLNVSAGVLHHGSETQTLSSDGRADIRWGGARLRTAPWRLTQAAAIQPDAPVYLRVSISPI